MYNAELQMLRELAWFLLPKQQCCFCHEPLISASSDMTFGHRRHKKVRAKLTIHHADEDRSNNTTSNLFLSHAECHKRYHNNKRGGQNYGCEEEGREEEVEEEDVTPAS